MSSPKKAWWGYAIHMIRRYHKGTCNEDELKAVEAAIEETKKRKNGEERMAVIEMTLMKGSHNAAGAALKCYCSESSAKQYRGEFIRLVGQNFKCDGLK